MISTDKLKNKEVINIGDGRSLGFVYDIEVDLDKGLFSKGEGDTVIKWERVRTVGDDVILVDMDGF